MATLEDVNNILEILEAKKPKRMVDFFQSGFKGKFVILKVLYDKGEITAGDLSNELNVSTARIAVALNEMCKVGLLTKTKPKEDKRKTLVKLTDQGEKIVLEKGACLKNKILFHLNKLTREEIDIFIKILKKF